MTAETPHILSWLAMSVAVGAALYVFDRYFGVPLLGWLYKMTHEHPLPAGVERGLIYNRKSRTKFAAACVLSLLQSFFAVSSSGINPFIEVLSFFLEVPLIMLGFYLGPWLYRLWESREEIFDTVDQLESGDLDLSREIKDASAKAVENVKVAVHGVLGEPAKEQAVPEPAPPEPHKTEDESEDPRELLSQYLRKD